MKPRPEPLEPLLTPRQTATILNTSVKTVLRRIRAGKLPAVRDEGLVRIAPSDLRRYMEENRKNGPRCRDLS